MASFEALAFPAGVSSGSEGIALAVTVTVPKDQVALLRDCVHPFHGGTYGVYTFLGVIGHASSNTLFMSYTIADT